MKNDAILNTALINVQSKPGFIPSMLGLANGFVAPGSDAQSCAIGYDQGNNPFRHRAVHDPRRFTVFAIKGTTAAGSVTFLRSAQLSQLTLFVNGVDELDPDAQMAAYGPKTRSLTNVEKGGFLVPPGYEGLVSTLGFRPMFLNPAPVTTPGPFAPGAAFLPLEADLWRELFSGISAQISYWETTGKFERDCGPLSRWPVPDQVFNFQTSINGAPGSFGKSYPLQYHVPTLGPAERRSDERADRLNIIVTLDHDITVPSPAGNVLPVGTDVDALIACELGVGLMTDVQVKRDAMQDASLAELQAQIAALKAKVGG